MGDRRFVILQHDHPFLHWDFLIEGPTAATTWRLMRRPCLNEPILAEPIPDHRLLYLDYEGPVSGNRGSVARILSGSVTLQTEPTRHSPLQIIDLAGQSFTDRAVMFQTNDGRTFVRFE